MSKEKTYRQGKIDGAKSFAKLGKEMRQAQQRYFDTRSDDALREAKKLEDMKPEITNGNWKVVETSKKNRFGIRSDKGFICFMVDSDGFDAWKNYLSDAKAISAVPEMIDALIDARKVINDLHVWLDSNDWIEDEEQDARLSSVVSKAKQALTKAGCEE